MSFIIVLIIKQKPIYKVMLHIHLSAKYNVAGMFFLIIQERDNPIQANRLSVIIKFKQES